MKIKILIADDHKIIREGLRSLLNEQEGMEVVAEADNGRMAVDLVNKHSPHIAIMDIQMPVLNGIEATREIVAKKGKTKVIVLSMYSDKRFISEMLKAGASGYLLKDCAFEEVANAVRTVLEGKIYLSPKIANVVIKDYVSQAAADNELKPKALTPREREILKKIVEGETTKQIAIHLKLSVKTIETHRTRIMDKLDIHTIPELTKYAIREGITSLEVKQT